MYTGPKVKQFQEWMGPPSLEQQINQWLEEEKPKSFKVGPINLVKRVDHNREVHHDGHVLVKYTPKS